jgi:phosphopantetheinyl transferase (holo-ACP synthase)
MERPGRATGVLDSTNREPQGLCHIAGRDMSTIPHSEIARWLATYGGLTPDCVPRIEAYAVRHLTKQAYNSTATEGQQRMKNAVTWAAKCACAKASATTMVTADQLDRELAADRPPSPPPEPAASAAWHQDNDLAVPDHLPADPGLTTQVAGPSTESAPTKLAGTPHPDPRPTPAPYTDVPMEDVEEVVDYEPSS